MATAPVPTTIVLIAGEASGDALGAELMRSITRRWPHVRFAGVGGPLMKAEGLVAWASIDALSVMGFAEVIRHLPRLMKLRHTWAERIIGLHPALVIGIDAPDFNLGLEKRARRAGIPCAHYVSPSIWAWRENRVRKIGQAADRVLCLFPMEPAIYARHGVDARFVGHPLAAAFPLSVDHAAARAELQLPAKAPVLALLPGSRMSEIERLGPTFLAAAARLQARMDTLVILVPTVHAKAREALQKQAMAHDDLRLNFLSGQAKQALCAANAALAASGTVTLEAMLAKCPMVVGYKVAPASYRIARWLRMLKTDIYALPNILARAAGMPLPVPECMQDACTPEALAEATGALLADDKRQTGIRDAFTHLHAILRGDMTAEDPAGPAAEALHDLIEPA